MIALTAISTVLNHPTKRAEPINPRSSRYPPLPVSNSELPNARKADYAPYLAQIRPEWDRFVRSQRQGRSGKAKLGEAALEEEGESRQEDQGADSSRFSLDRSSLRPPKQTRTRLPSLEAVPKVYFEEDFSLSSPHVFGRVVEATDQAAGQDASADGFEPALNQILQEKLSYYSDIIEQHLIVEIGARSSSFFAALSNLQDLSAEADSCLTKVDSLREELSAIDENQAKKGLQLVLRQSKRRELGQMQSALQQVKELTDRRDMVDLLVKQGEFEEALDLMESIRSMLKQSTSSSSAEGDGSIDISKVPALAGIVPGFSKHDTHISTALRQELLNVLGMELRDRIAEPSTVPTVEKPSPADQRSIRRQRHKSMRNSISIAASQLNANGSKSLFESEGDATQAAVKRIPKTPESIEEKNDALRKRIRGLVLGLVRTHGIERTVREYEGVAAELLQSVAKSHIEGMSEQLVSLLSQKDAPADSQLATDAAATKLREASHENFLEQAYTFFEALLEGIAGMAAQMRVVLLLLHEAAHDSTPNGNAALPPSNGQGMSRYDMPEGVSPSTPSLVSEILHSTGEAAHALVSRLISIRSEQHSKLSLRDFLAMFRLCWSFVLRSELTNKRMITGLRGTLLNQAKAFLVAFHFQRVAAAAKAVEEERWEPVSVPAQAQKEVDRMVGSATQDPADFIILADEDEEEGEEGAVKDKPANGKEESQAPEASKTLRIEDREYFVVGATLDVLTLLGEYLRMIVNLPLLTTEAMTRVVEFLKQVNSRTCQVVLGAGAMRSAGLKNITAKNLGKRLSGRKSVKQILTPIFPTALASQTLSVFISLTSYIRETVRRHLSVRQAVMLTEFDKLKRDYQEHQYEIHAKLVSIMSDRLVVHCKSLRVSTERLFESRSIWLTLF